MVCKRLTQHARGHLYSPAEGRLAERHLALFKSGKIRRKRINEGGESTVWSELENPPSDGGISGYLLLNERFHHITAPVPNSSGRLIPARNQRMRTGVPPNVPKCSGTTELTIASPHDRLTPRLHVLL